MYNCNLNLLIVLLQLQFIYFHSGFLPIKDALSEKKIYNINQENKTDLIKHDSTDFVMNTIRNNKRITHGKTDQKKKDVFSN